MNIVAIQECCSGNESVGNMWLETKIFFEDARITDIIEWSKRLPCANGKLIITVESDR
jgi:hypothetical protein